MTKKSSQNDAMSRREFVVATGAAAVVGGALAATGTSASAAASSNEICRMDAVALAEKIRTKQLSATEVTEAVLGRMDKLNPALGAFCTPSPDVARAQAKAVDADIMAGKDCRFARRRAGRYQRSGLYQRHQDHVWIDHLQGLCTDGRRCCG
jgi:hypothetical protein